MSKIPPISFEPIPSIVPGGPEKSIGSHTGIAVTVHTFAVPAAPVEYAVDYKNTLLTTEMDSPEDLGSLCISSGDGTGLTAGVPPGGRFNIIHGESAVRAVTICNVLAVITTVVVTGVTSTVPSLFPAVPANLTFVRATGGARAVSHGPTVALGSKTT